MMWKNLFRSHILDRGYEYYHSGAVKNFLRNGNLISADVVGNEDYEVTIEIKNGEIDYMYCSCPYATDDNNCKHMAAVLFELENPSNSTKESNVDLDKLVSKDEIHKYGRAHHVNLLVKNKVGLKNLFKIIYRIKCNVI